MGSGSSDARIDYRRYDESKRDTLDVTLMMDQHDE